MTEPLKPCPFCGQSRALVELVDRDTAVVVLCSCGARGPQVPIQVWADARMRDAAITQAIAFWNGRR